MANTDAQESVSVADRSAGIAGDSTRPDGDSPEHDLLTRFRSPLLRDDDPDGPINTDRPTFTPSKLTVPRGRLQFESGFTFNHELSPAIRSSLYDIPELAVRFGLASRVELRALWTGQTWIQSQSRETGRFFQGGGPSDMQVGFKWQLLQADSNRKWIPVTALITSVVAPTGGVSPLGAHTVEPHANLIYGWDITKKFNIAAATGYLGMRVTNLGPRHPADSFEQFHQSVVAFYSPTKRTTLFYEWYVLMFTSAADNRPTHFMDGGVLYLVTPNMQLDLRAGFGLSGRPDDFFTGAGFSVRF
jgi:hypothetical protein